MKRLLGVAATACVGTLLIWAFLEGRKEIEKEREREKPVAVPARIAKAEDGGTKVLLDEKTQTISGIVVAKPARKGEVILVPRSALLWVDGKTWIYRETHPGEFERAEVRLSQPMESDTIVTLAREISPESKVIVTGAQLVLSEELKSQIEVLGEEGSE